MDKPGKHEPVKSLPKFKTTTVLLTLNSIHIYKMLKVTVQSERCFRLMEHISAVKLFRDVPL